jgi:hypothetical protein
LDFASQCRLNTQKKKFLPKAQFGWRAELNVMGFVA